MSKHSVTIIAMLIFTAGPVSAQFETKVTGVGTTAASFLEIGSSEPYFDRSFHVRSSL